MDPAYREWTEAFIGLIETYSSVTILSHIRPDPDAIGTALGIYHWLKASGKRVEVVNASRELPAYLDFLPGFDRIKHRMDYEDALIIACDCGSIDRLGFDVSGREVVNIDHHLTNTRFGTLNAVDSRAVASAEVAWRLLSPLGTVPKEAAVAWYVALVSDTRNFTTQNMHRGVFDCAAALVDRGVDIPEVTRQVLHRRSLASLRILGRAIDSLELRLDARVALMSLTRADRLATGARDPDLDGIVDYARSLVTVEVAVMLVEYSDYIKVSLRSKGADVARIAQHFGGGGHAVAAGFEMEGMDLESAQNRIVKMIETLEVLV